MRLRAPPVIVLLGVTVASSPEDTVVRRARYVMGTVFEITVRGGEREALVRAVEQAFRSIRRSDEVLSHYRADSDLSRWNRGERDGLDAEFEQLLERSREFERISGGAFRVTVAPLVELWRNAAVKQRLPRASELGRAREQRLQIEFGAIGKGWAVDRAVAVLREQGVRHALIDGGTSTLFAMGDDGRGRGWPVAVRGQDGEFRLTDEAVSTSARGEKSYLIDGHEYGHIIDPRSGWPVEGIESVTVTAPTATEADALSTAVFVLGLAEGAALLESRGRDGLLCGEDEIRRVECRKSRFALAASR